jgi:hypothetical protein
VVKLRGGTPGGDFMVAASDPGAGFGSAGSAQGTYDAAGNARVAITNVFPPSGTIDPIRGQKVHLTVRDFSPGGTVDTKLDDVLITNLTMKVAPRPSNPRKPRWVKVSGTPFAKKHVYGFVVKGKGRHVVQRFRLGKGNVCGFVRRKVRVAPSPFQYTRYHLYVNAGAKLNKRKALRWDFRIFRTF